MRSRHRVCTFPSTLSRFENEIAFVLNFSFTDTTTCDSDPKPAALHGCSEFDFKNDANWIFAGVVLLVDLVAHVLCVSRQAIRTAPF
jgi:hypothetical protein